MILRCPHPGCRRTFEVSEEDPDATLSEIHGHLMFSPHFLNAKEAVALLAKVKEVRP